jgi:CyaY protein
VSPAEYDELAHAELESLTRALDALDAEALDAELASDILTLEFSDGARYVVNSHRAARQIWLAADRSAWHFDWDATQRRWIAQKTSEELWQTLERLLQGKLGPELRLRRVDEQA